LSGLILGGLTDEETYIGFDHCWAATAQAEITTCTGDYALCAASTCKPTGKMITGASGIAYPEVACKCPILNGEAIADTTMGNMQGSCNPTDSEHVWSLFAPKKVLSPRGQQL
jgi:hypothetical protein